MSVGFNKENNRNRQKVKEIYIKCIIDSECTFTWNTYVIDKVDESGIVILPFQILTSRNNTNVYEKMRI